LEAKLDLLDMLERYTHYGWTKKQICRKWGISVQMLYALKKESPQENDTARRTCLNAITPAEREVVRSYALSHTELNHREMAYRMIDEDVAFMSPSSVYRILKEFNLLSVRGKRDRTGNWNAHQKLTGPDQVWQTDLMTVRHHGRDFYLLTYFDVYSRYVVYQSLCTSMTGDTIKETSERALAETGKKPESIQSDNGSCYISAEYRSFASKNKIMHRFIHPHCPNENSEIERYHRTARELADTGSADDFLQLEQILKEKKSYYNDKRYHSAIGFVTPYAKYTGQADSILAERKKKLEKAQDKRFKENFDMMKLTNPDKKAA